MTDSDPALEDSAASALIKLRTEWAPLLPRRDVILNSEGIAWKRDGGEAGHWVSWELIGGVSNGIAGEQAPSVSILALDGSPFGSIEGLLTFEGEATSLAHAMGLVRPGLFVEVDGYPWTGGCIRREVATAEDESAAPTAHTDCAAVTDAEAQFAERLGEDLDRILGAGLAVDDIELSSTGDQATVRATLLVEGRIETIEVTAPDEAGLYRPLIERAALLRLQSAFWRMVGPT